MSSKLIHMNSIGKACGAGGWRRYLLHVGWLLALLIWLPAPGQAYGPSAGRLGESQPMTASLPASSLNRARLSDRPDALALDTMDFKRTKDPSLGSLDATLSASSVISTTAPKWLDAPTLDGQCTDPAYDQAGTIALLDAAGRPGATAKVIHSALDFYVCLAGIPVGSNNRVAVRVDADHSRSSLLEAGDYQFSVTSGGSLSVTHGSAATGTFVPLAIPPTDFAAVASLPDRAGFWTAELRISLEWLGGYARTDGLSLAVEGTSGNVPQSWPAGASPRSPSTWGDLALGPLYPNPVSAGSAFVDGREGYFVVPYAPELNNLRALTIEAWVRIVDGDCGTLVGNDLSMSYWLALCNVVRFSPGRSVLDHGAQPLGPGWHHVAVTVDALGIRRFYVDGVLDYQSSSEAAAPLGASDRMLRLGSDRNAPAGLDHLHGYLRELRLWNGVRTAAEIHDNAFRNLSGTESGLVGLWPFTSGLQDIARGHHAGLIGNASLARETRDVTAFPPPPTPVPYDYGQPSPQPPWDQRVPIDLAKITLDGACRPAEYATAAPVRLLPERPYFLVDVLEAPDGLYLCTTFLFGDSQAGGDFTVWIDRDGRGGTAPGPADLRLRLTPDGRLAAGTGDGRGYGGAAPAGVTYQTMSGPHLEIETRVFIESPWWASEVRIPYAALAPFRPGQPLHLALQYTGWMSSTAALPAGTSALAAAAAVSTTLTARWPATFDPAQPGSWGTAATATCADAVLDTAGHWHQPVLLLTDKYDLNRDGRIDMIDIMRTAASLGTTCPASSVTARTGSSAPPAVRPAATPSGPRPLAPLHDPPANPPPPPTKDEFTMICKLYGNTSGASKWAWPNVDWGYAAYYAIAQAEGTLKGFSMSTGDSHFNHDMNDIDMVLQVDKGYEWLKLKDAPGDLGLEVEYGGFDPRAFPMEVGRPLVQGRPRHGQGPLDLRLPPRRRWGPYRDPPHLLLGNGPT